MLFLEAFFGIACYTPILTIVDYFTELTIAFIYLSGAFNLFCRFSVNNCFFAVHFEKWALKKTQFIYA